MPCTYTFERLLNDEKNGFQKQIFCYIKNQNNSNIQSVQKKNVKFSILGVQKSIPY